jgi:hypothetical protein
LACLRRHGYTAPFKCRVLLRGDGEDLRAARLFTRQRRCILQNLRKAVEELVRKFDMGWTSTAKETFERQ